MKKWIIALSVLFVAALISTICFGVSLGSRAVVELFSDGGIVETWADAIERRIDDNIASDWRGDSVSVGQKETFGLYAGGSISVIADCGNIRVVGGTGEGVETLLESTNGQFTLTWEDEHTLRLLSTQTDFRHGVGAQLTVYVPQSLPALDIETPIGNVDVENVLCDTLTVQAGQGNLKLQRITAKQISAKADLGDVEIEDVEASESLALECECGSVEYRLPQTPFTLDFAVETGNVQVDAGVPRTYIRSTEVKGAGCTGSLANPTDGTASSRITLQIGTGNLEITSDTDGDIQ